MRTNYPMLLWSLVALCLICGPGCSDQLATYPVVGQVQFVGGSPVHVGSIELKSREHNVQARGQIEPDGSFSLTTYQDGDGAVAGLHDCVIIQMVMTEDMVGHRASTLGVIDRRYGSYSTTDLVIEIEDSGENQVLLEVQGLRKVQPENHTH